MAIDLLPAEQEAPRCAPFTRSLGASPAGSGLGLDRIVIVSVPAPWPKPALSHPALKPLVAPLTASPVTTRLFAGEPTASTPAVEVFDRWGLQATHTEFRLDETVPAVERQRWLERTIALIAQTPSREMTQAVLDHPKVVDDPEAIVPTGASQGGAHGPIFLVCTQGSHDTCCGVQGQAFADLLEAHPAGVHVRRVSHTGGHRFAPTAISLPDGRMWAWLDEDLADRIIRDQLTAQDLRTRCRGWWGATKGPAQVAELAARIDNGGSFTDEPSIDASGDEVVVVSGADRWTVRVDKAREIPSIACESPGGLPAKQGIEYAWTIIGRAQSQRASAEEG